MMEKYTFMGPGNLHGVSRDSLSCSKIYLYMKYNNIEHIYLYL